MCSGGHTSSIGDVVELVFWTLLTPSKSDFGDGGTLHVRAELKKHQREAAIKATQMDAHVQCAVLAGIPATRPSPDPPQSVTSSTSATTTTHSGVVRQPPKRRNGGRRAKRQHRALALAAARHERRGQ
jgi:hypothetical protein